MRNDVTELTTEPINSLRKKKIALLLWDLSFHTSTWDQVK